MEYLFFWLAKPLADLAWFFIFIASLFVAIFVWILYIVILDWTKSLFKKNAPVAHKEPENEH